MTTAGSMAKFSASALQPRVLGCTKAGWPSGVPLREAFRWQRVGIAGNLRPKGRRPRGALHQRHLTSWGCPAGRRRRMRRPPGPPGPAAAASGAVPSLMPCKRQIKGLGALGGRCRWAAAQRMGQRQRAAQQLPSGRRRGFYSWRHQRSIKVQALGAYTQHQNGSRVSWQLRVSAGASAMPRVGDRLLPPLLQQHW